MSQAWEINDGALARKWALAEHGIAHKNHLRRGGRCPCRKAESPVAGVLCSRGRRLSSAARQSLPGCGTFKINGLNVLAQTSYLGGLYGTLLGVTTRPL